jgi:hypothetical protein
MRNKIFLKLISYLFKNKITLSFLIIQFVTLKMHNEIQHGFKVLRHKKRTCLAYNLFLNLVFMFGVLSGL